MKGNPLRKRLIVLFATVALLMVAAVPVSAAPGGIPGPPAGHEKARDDVASDGADATVKKLPDWAKAYGKRIKDEYDIPFGHLRQCAGLADEEPVAEGDDVVSDDKPKKALEACPEDLAFPDENGAKAFAEFAGLLVFTEDSQLVVGI
jgi:hypothetical protein